MTRLLPKGTRYAPVNYDLPMFPLRTANHAFLPVLWRTPDTRGERQRAAVGASGMRQLRSFDASLNACVEKPSLSKEHVASTACELA